MYVEKRGRGRKRAREEDGQVTEAGQPEASSRVALVDPRKGEGGRPREKNVLPEGWQLIYNVRKTGLKKGTPDRFFVTPDGALLKSKKEMEAHLYLDSLSER